MSEPIYIKIEKYLRDLIDSGEIKQGELLPSENKLCEKFNVTRMTVRSAFNNLVKEGYITRKRGIPTNGSHNGLNLLNFAKSLPMSGTGPGLKT